MSKKTKKAFVRELELREKLDSVRSNIERAETMRKTADDIHYALAWEAADLMRRLEELGIRGV